MSSLIKATQIISISVSLLASGGIATLSLFDIPELKSQPASRSLPMTRWLFSRGSHIFPQAAVISSAGFAFLAYNALPLGKYRAFTQLFKLASNSSKVNAYLAAAILTLSIGPFTSFAMVPTNFTLIKMNEDKGGARSRNTEIERSKQPDRAGQRSADDSVDGKDAPNQLTDLSGPQTQTSSGTSKAEDRKVNELLDKFAALNSVRAVLMAAGGMVGLWAALL